MRPCLNKRSVRVAGDQVLRRIVGHEADQFQQGLNVPVLAQHIAGHHHTGIPRIPQCVFDALLFFAEPCTVKIADMQDGEILQIRRQVQDGQLFLAKQHAAGNRSVKRPQQNDQHRQQDQNRVAEMMAPVSPVELRSKNVLIPLPPHGSHTSFPAPIIGG